MLPTYCRFRHPVSPGGLSLAVVVFEGRGGAVSAEARILPLEGTHVEIVIIKAEVAEAMAIAAHVHDTGRAGSEKLVHD